jgi:Pilus formation protein N terminal region
MSFTRVFPFLFLAFAIGSMANSARAEDSDGVIRVTVDQAKIEPAPAGATTLIVGNPAIADVTVIKGGQLMVVTAKSFGQTNLIALDEKGGVVYEKQLRVLPPRSVLVVQRGTARQSYSCDPWCMPSIQMGDDAAPFSDTINQVQQHSTLAQGVAGTTGSQSAAK